MDDGSRDPATPDLIRRLEREHPGVVFGYHDGNVLTIRESLTDHLPLAGRKDFWTVLVDGRNGDLLGYLPLDSF